MRSEGVSTSRSGVSSGLKRKMVCPAATCVPANGTALFSGGSNVPLIGAETIVDWPGGTTTSPPTVRLRTTAASINSTVRMASRCSACGVSVIVASVFSSAGTATLAGGLAL
jgi:hypothetical protein